MDIESQHATKLMDALTRSHDRMIEFGRMLRLRPEVKRIYYTFSPFFKEDPLPGNSYGRLDVGLFVDLSNSLRIEWYYSLGWSDEGWHIASEVGGGDMNAGHDTLAEFPIVTVTTLDDCIREIHQATENLIQHEHLIERLL